MLQFQYFIISILMALTVTIQDQPYHNKQDQALFHVLKEKDSLLFERAFNHCETSLLNELIADDFEFYHDQSGVTNSKASFIEGMKKGICNPSNTTTSRRELISGSLKVFPLKSKGEVYGAIQEGTHRFFERTNGVEVPGSIAQFSHLWVLQDSSWVLKRVFSYDHHMETKNPMLVADHLLDSYIGKYEAKESGLVIISRTDHGLHINAGGMSADILAESDTVFYHQESPLSFEFMTNADGQVEKFIVRERGKIVEEAFKI